MGVGGKLAAVLKVGKSEEKGVPWQAADHVLSLWQVPVLNLRGFETYLITGEWFLCCFSC